MEFVKITDKKLSFCWDGTQEGYFKIWDMLPNTQSVRISTRTLTIEDYDGNKTIAEPGEWVIIDFPGIYTAMSDDDYRKLFRKD